MVQGGIGDCTDRDFAGIFVRLDNPKILNFIKSAMIRNKTDGKIFLGK